MVNRFRKLPPRIHPRYETQPVSDPPLSPEVQPTNWLTPAGQVAAYEQLADAVTRPTRRRWRRGVVVVWAVAALALGLVAAVMALWDTFWSLTR